MKSFDEWMQGGYLPPILRDFHDQKRIFKIVGEMVARRQARAESSYDRMMTDLPNWVVAHIYVIDFFLWFMAKRGYTLQRSRAKFDFIDLDSDIAAFEQREHEAFKAMIEAERGAPLDTGA